MTATLENAEIANMLEEVADLLAFDDANPYRVRAYRNGATTVRRYGEPMAVLVRKGADLTALPTIGDDLAALIDEAVRTGRMRSLDALRLSAPAMVSDLVSLEGIGSKKARALWQTLGITSVEQLHRAVLDHRVRTVPGFGEASERRLAAVLAGRNWTAGDRFPLYAVVSVANELKSYLEEADGAERVEIAGSYRRGRETVGDLDVVVVSGTPASIIDRFTHWNRVQRKVLAGESKATVVLDSGLQVDLRVADAANQGAMLQYFTGSKAHSIALRIRARRKGLKLNEYGVWRGKKRIAGVSENEVYAALGLDLIPAELRENRGEIELAAAHRLPKLVTLDDLKGDLHAVAPDKAAAIALIREAAARGYAYLGLGPHVSSTTRDTRLTANSIRTLFAAIDVEAAKHAGLHTFKLIEADVDESGALDLRDSDAALADYVIGSVQNAFDLSRGMQTKRLLEVLNDDRLAILSHPTGRLVARRPPYDLDMARVAEAAARKSVALELSADPERLDLTDAHCLIARDAGAAVALSVEARKPSDFDRMELGLLQARRGWLTAKHVLNTAPLTRIKAWASHHKQSEQAEGVA